MKHVVIIHGYKGKPESNWKPWLSSELETRGFKVDIPSMPSSETPLQSSWVEMIAKIVGQPTSDTFLVGHSLGCIAILNYLETLQQGETIGAALLVAVFGGRFEGYQGQHDSFFSHKLNWQTVRNHCRNFVAIHSDDDPYIKIDQMELFKDKLGSKGVLVRGMGHFGSADGVYELPIARDELLAIARSNQQFTDSSS